MSNERNPSDFEALQHQVGIIVEAFSKSWGNFAGNSVGKKPGISEIHNSTTTRYNKFLPLFVSSENLENYPEDLKEIIAQIRAESPIRIKDSSVGTGEAILGLIQKLTEFDKRIELSINGLVNPIESIYPEILQELLSLSAEELVVSFAVRDLTRHHLNEQTSDIFIISNVHQYLTKDQLTLAISNALESSKIVVLQPYPSHPYSAMLIYSVDSDVRTFILPVSN